MPPTANCLYIMRLNSFVTILDIIIHRLSAGRYGRKERGIVIKREIEIILNRSMCKQQYVIIKVFCFLTTFILAYSKQLGIFNYEINKIEKTFNYNSI